MGVPSVQLWKQADNGNTYYDPNNNYVFKAFLVLACVGKPSVPTAHVMFNNRLYPADNIYSFLQQIRGEPDYFQEMDSTYTAIWNLADANFHINTHLPCMHGL